MKDFSRTSKISNLLRQIIGDSKDQNRRSGSQETPSERTVAVEVMGGLGNQLFQVAAAFAQAQKTRSRLALIPVKNNRNRSFYWNTILLHFSQFVRYDFPLNLEKHKEKNPTTYEIIENVTGGGQALFGYFQSSKYFAGYEKEIYDALVANRHTSEAIKNPIRHLDIPTEDLYVLHARQTDYLKNPAHHGPLDYKYYERAVSQIRKRTRRPHFVLTADDLGFWTTDGIASAGISKDECTIWYNKDDVSSFNYLQRFCNFVISNSTFAWWIAWLGTRYRRDAYVIAPERWFGPEGPKHYEDIYEQGWLRL